jgi:hypothetical protein
VFIIVSENASDAHEGHGDVVGVESADECAESRAGTPGAGVGEDGTPEPENGEGEGAGTPSPDDGMPVVRTPVT